MPVASYWLIFFRRVPIICLPRGSKKLKFLTIGTQHDPTKTTSKSLRESFLRANQ